MKILSDTSITCAISYINNMGGIRPNGLNNLAKSIWLSCVDRNIWTSAYHVPGADNPADIYSMKTLSGN